MKKMFTIVTLLTIMIFNEMLIIKPANALAPGGCLKVNSTYVSPHYRTNTNANPYNNFRSYKENNNTLLLK